MNRSQSLLLASVGLAFLTSACGPSANHASRAPAPARCTIPFTAANGSNALSQVASLVALGPRDAGTAGGEQASRWLAGQLQQAGLSAHIDTFSDETPSGPLTCHNVIAEIPGRSNTWIVLLSHFDTKSGIDHGFQGANDGGSSTGLLLELARLLKQGPASANGLLFAFLDGEECRVTFGPHDGLHGSRHLAAQLTAESRAVEAVILMDMIGDCDLNVALPVNGTQSLTLLTLESARAVGARDHFQLFDGGMLDDHQPFLDAGFPAVDLIDFSYGSAPGLNDYWHTPQDTLDKLSSASLTVVGQVVCEMLRRLGQ